jgi:glycosyltransferase involved in cell wall biosynthesis
MDKKQDLLLSICIPTYNRCDVLEKTLLSIVDQSAFDERVEIVISDNFSTDNTKDLVFKYQKRYKNIIYQCNEKNILDQNFTKALLLGNGDYLKLLNDTALMKQGVLESLLFYIDKYRLEKPELFFFNNNERYANKIVSCSSFNQFVDTASYYIGWIANFGAWKAHFDSIENKDRCSFLQFVQIDWSFRMVENKKSVVAFGDWIQIQTVNKKGGYNIFEVFLDNYLFLYLPYLNRGQLSYSVFRREKNRLLKWFLAGWINLLVLKKDDGYNFGTIGWKRIFWRHYKSNPLLYIVLFKLSLRFIYNKVKNREI